MSLNSGITEPERVGCAFRNNVVPYIVNWLWKSSATSRNSRTWQSGRLEPGILRQVDRAKYESIKTVFVYEGWYAQPRARIQREGRSSFAKQFIVQPQFSCCGLIESVWALHVLLSDQFRTCSGTVRPSRLWTSFERKINDTLARLTTNRF
jgi:hypothetical protein